MEFPVLWSGLYTSQKNIWLGCFAPGSFMTVWRLPVAPSHAFGRSRWAALALKSPVGEWSCNNTYIHTYIHTIWMWEQSLMQMTQKVNNNHKLAYKDRASLPPASWVSHSLHNRLCCCDHLRAATLVLQVVKISICSGCFNVFLNMKCF